MRKGKIGNLLSLLLFYSHKIRPTSFYYEDALGNLLKTQAYESADEWIAEQKDEIQQESIELVL